MPRSGSWKKLSQVALSVWAPGLQSVSNIVSIGKCLLLPDGWLEGRPLPLSSPLRPGPVCPPWPAEGRLQTDGRRGAASLGLLVLYMFIYFN